MIDSSKVEESISILRETEEKYTNPAIAWAGGKDSSLVIYLSKKEELSFDIIVLDTSYFFSETYDFIERFSREMNIDYEMIRNERALSKGMNPDNYSHLECCHELKTNNLKRAVREKNIDALIVGIRRDEHEERAKETIYSSREDPDYIRVHPILEWTEEEVWSYIEKENILYNPLYDRGFRSIGCASCTEPVLEESESERSGRSQDKEKIMKRLRDLGYVG